MSNTKGSRKFLAATAAIAVAALLALLGRDEPSRSRRAPSRVRESEMVGARGTETAPRARHRVYGFAPGDLLQYRFEERQSLDTLPAEARAPDSPAAVETYFAGVLALRVYASDGPGTLVGLSLEQLDVEVRTAGARGPVTKGLEAQMRDEALVLLAPDGRIARIVCAPSAGREARNLWRNLLARWQTVRPDDSASEWTTSEEDTTGTYAAEYRTADGYTIGKRKVRYESLHGDPGMASAARIDGAAEHLLGDVLESIRSSEELEIHPEGELVLVRARSRFELTLVGRATSDPVAADAAARAAGLRDGDAMTIAGVELPSPAGRAVEAADIRAELAALKLLLDSGRRDRRAELSAMVRIVAALERDAEAPAEIVRWLDQWPLDARLRSMLLGSLGAAGTEAAQRALASVILSPQRPDATRLTALSAIVQVERPTAELEQALRTLSASEGDLGTSALLLLGAVGSRVRDSDPDRFSRMREELVKAAEGSRGDLSTHVAALEAIGNLAPRDVPEIVKSALESEEECVRIAAVHVLGKVTGTHAESLLAPRLSDDPDEAVRLAAVEALAALPGPESLARLSSALRSNTSDEVRCACLRALAARATESATRELFDRVSREDPSADVREVAQVLLRR